MQSRCVEIAALNDVSMFGVVCPQCKKPSDGASNRLVRDCCGHQKCRKCLLVDEEQCLQCQSEDNKESVIKVITCNGGAIKNETNASTASNGVKYDQKVKVKESEKKFGKRRNYRSIVVPNHITVLKDPIQYKCNICNKTFTTKSHIKYHVYCTGETKPFQCGQCTKTFISKTHLDVHALKHSGTKPFSCNICQKSFSEKSKLKRHNLLHSSTKSYVCSECGKAFRGKESLKIHILIHRGEKPFTCRVCNLKFNNTSNLNKHLISHSTEKSHMCDECGKRFKLKWALTVHRRSHQRMRAYQCITCSRSFTNEKDMQRHQLIHLETKAYNCSICSTNFRRKDNLYRHFKNTHPGKEMDPVSITVKQLLKKPPKPIDNPNAINVITVSPVCKAKMENETSKAINRAGTVINGPLKLAFKTSAFKNSYNINRSCDYDLAESVNICQKILSPHSPPTRSIIRKIAEPTPSSTEICQKILSPFSTKPLHYETSFEHKTHATIKNMKFKLPSNYLDYIKNNDRLMKEIIPSKETKSTAATSVIVNSMDQSNIHWRRRTAQNLNSKILEN